MFSNLAQGSIIYGLETNDNIKHFTAYVIEVSPARPAFNNNTNNYSQFPQPTVNIIVTVNGEKREFKQVPGNAAIANFGSESFILADSKDSLNSYIESMLQTSKSYIANADKYKELIPKYEAVYEELNPNFKSSGDNHVKALEEKVDKLENYLKQIIALSKSENNNELNP